VQPWNVLDFPPDDGVRDVFRWSRFARPSFLAGAVALVVLTAVAGAGAPGRKAAAAGHEHALGLADSAVRLARTLPTR
jgi:hypothetical protein